uniref:Uncharacterized protein n=1 Tax=Pyrodinium bahamense TaxID=73915 RepID=A0A7S0AUS2_9DINO
MELVVAQQERNRLRDLLGAAEVRLQEQERRIVGLHTCKRQLEERCSELERRLGEEAELNERLRQALRERELARRWAEERLDRLLAGAPDGDLQAALAQAMAGRAALERRCMESTEVARASSDAARSWQRRAQMAEEELARARVEAASQEAATEGLQQRLRAEEELTVQLRAALERDVALCGGSGAGGEASDELRRWVLQSLNEVNRSAHGRTWDPFEPKFDPAFEGREWMNILESFRQNHQTRIGFGCRAPNS